LLRIHACHAAPILNSFLIYPYPMVEVRAIASLFPTEDEDLVRRCLLNLFPDSKISLTDGGMEAVSDDLSRFKEIIRNHRILDSTRSVMLRGLSEGRIDFQLNKQAALQGKVSFAEGRPPLGPIEVRIMTDDPQALIDDVAPRTVNGEIP